MGVAAVINLLIGIALLIPATWYIAETISSKAGPFNVFTRIRERLPLGGLTSCIYCTVPWVALVLYTVYFRHFAIESFVHVFAIAGAALMLRSYTGVRHD